MNEPRSRSDFSRKSKYFIQKILLVCAARPGRESGKFSKIEQKSTHQKSYSRRPEVRIPNKSSRNGIDASFHHINAPRGVFTTYFG